MQQLYNEKGTQGTTGKEGEPLGNPLNHHAPRWQTLRNESTGKDRRGHHRNPLGKQTHRGIGEGDGLPPSASTTSS